MDVIANHFQAENALDCRILYIQSQHYFGGGVSGGDTRGTHKSTLRCLDPDTSFRLARQRSHCFDFT